MVLRAIGAIYFIHICVVLDRFCVVLDCCIVVLGRCIVVVIVLVYVPDVLVYEPDVVVAVGHRLVVFWGVSKVLFVVLQGFVIETKLHIAESYPKCRLVIVGVRPISKLIFLQCLPPLPKLS